ncbi:MAG: hypothetical protein ABIF71_06630 [Planctomycetota bacterium]
MAITTMHRVDITAHTSLRERIVAHLQRAGFVEIIRRGGQDDLVYGEGELETRIKAQEQTVQEIAKVIAALGALLPMPGLRERLTAEPPVIGAAALDRLADDRAVAELIQTTLAGIERLPVIDAELRKLEAEQAAVIPWVDYPVREDVIAGLRCVRVFFGRLPVAALDPFRAALAARAPLAHLEVVLADEDAVHLTVAYHDSAADAVAAVLAAHAVVEIPVLRKDCDARATLTAVMQAIHALARERGDLMTTLTRNADRLATVKAAGDLATNRYQALEARRYFGNTRTVFQIRGWVPAAEGERLRSDLAAMGPVDVTVRPPEAKDGIPPVLLRNRGIFHSFEFVIDLFGLPSYRGFDPVVALMPFFFVFFGLCMLDAGYGTVLALAMVVFMRVLKMRGKVFMMFVYCGIAAVIGGVMTGSYFGWSILTLPDGHWAAFLKRLVWFDPLGSTPASFMGLMLQGSMAFFFLSIVLGYIQVVWATLLAAFQHWKSGDRADALGIDLAWVMAYVGLAFVAAAAPSMVILPSWNITSLHMPGLILLLGGLGVRFLGYPVLKQVLQPAERPVRAFIGNTVMSFIFILDNTKNLMGNVLSYCRLMALGLSGGVIGSIVNQLAIMVFNLDIPVVNILGMVIILVGGHTFNLLVSLLGSFVHTARLHYVEFFPYFFMDGGERFRPLKHEYKYVQVKN